MNEIATTTEPVHLSAETMEHVLGTGDISKLTVPQRVEFYRAACSSLNLNPITRPIRFLSFQGQMQAYFTRDGTDQLRKNNKITLRIISNHNDGDVYVVTVGAKAPDGREDQDIGAVTLGRTSGDSRANALMKCVTKAKRRVTLSICGLGWPSEDELDTMPGAKVFDAEDAAPPPPAPPPPRRTIGQWLDAIEIALKDAADRVEVDRILDGEEVLDIVGKLPPGSASAERFRTIKAEALKRHAPTIAGGEDDELPPIKGEENVMAG